MSALWERLVNPWVCTCGKSGRTAFSYRRHGRVHPGVPGEGWAFTILDAEHDAVQTEASPMEGEQ